MEKVIIYTDGACSGNPGPGGWGTILMYKDIKNLYFAGEICNVDGVCGGFNLQWAWTSGHIVGENL